MTVQEAYMLRALELAEQGRGNVSPNPMVGCVIVKEGRIIGEGWHKNYGGPHAEVHAIQSVQDNKNLEGADLYVSLEPCAHHGKTPPCAELITQFKFRKVWICNTDPNPLVNGAGIRKIQEAGIEVTTGVLKEMGARLNRRFFTSTENQRPYVLLKWAETADGFIARENYESKWISNNLSRRLVHKWRSEEDAVMVGTNTARYDNPGLNTRDWTGKHPVRVVIDARLSLPQDLHLFDGMQKTIILNSLMDKAVSEKLEYVQFLPGENSVACMLDLLFQRNIRSLLVEGGAGMLVSFFLAGAWDEARIFKGKTTFGSGIPAPQLRGTLLHREMIGGDELSWYRNIKPV